MAEPRIVEFGVLDVGDRFIWLNEEYVKVEQDWLPRYGWVNMRGRPFYNGDTGHRFLEDDRKVIPVK